MRSIGLRSLRASLVRGGLSGLLWRAAVLMVLAPAGAAYGQTTFTVNSVADLVDADTNDGACDADLATPGDQCTLRAAVLQANAIAGADTILFDPSTNGTPLTLTRPCDPIGCFFDSGTDGDLNVVDDLVITGNGPANTVIQGGLTLAAAVDRVFRASAALTISGVTIRHGNSRDGEGGAVSANAPLTVVDSVITGNEAFNANGFGNGGGISSNADLILARVSISGNRASQGGGVHWHTSNDLLSITDSTFDNNEAFGGSGRGGGLNSSRFGPNPPVIVVSNTTFSGNTATEGCAVYHENAPLRLHSVTVAGNCTPGSPAAALVATYGDGNGNDGGEVRLKNSVVASAPGTDNCRVETLHGTPPGFFSEGHNLASDATCGLAQAGDVQGVSPVLGPLANNGGPTRTHLPLVGSPAIDTGTPVDCLPVDQRGLGRPADGDGNGSAVCDKGSVEVAAAPPPPPPTTGAVQGTVFDDPGQDGVRDPVDGGIAGVQACLFPTSPLVCTATAADGTYQFSGLTPGSYHVYVRVPGGRISSTPRARLVAIAAGGVVTGIDFGSFVPPPPPPPPPGLPPWNTPVITESVKGFFFVLRATPPCLAAAMSVTTFYAGGVTQSLRW